MLFKLLIKSKKIQFIYLQVKKVNQMKKTIHENVNETIYSKTLQNGLPVFLLPRNKMSKTFAIFTTNYGSIDRSFIPLNGENKITVPDGVAHFLEHKLFEKEDRDVFADFGKLGASPNAYTSFTKTAYLFSATNHIKENVEILLDFVQSPYFSDDSVEKEKGIIEQEIKMYEDQAENRSFMGTLGAMFKHHPVNIDIAGTVSSIYQITKEDLYTCYETFYHPSNMTLFIIGNFDPHAMMEMIEENQKKKTFQKRQDIQRFFPDEPRHVAKSEYRIQMPVSRPRMTIGIKESVDHLYGDEYLKKDLLQSMIVDYFFSRGGKFYQKLYQDRLINKSFFFSPSLERNYGYTLIGSNTDKPEQFRETLMELLTGTNNYQFSEEEVSLMKRKRIGKMLKQMNSLEYIANEFTHYHMLGIDFFDIMPRVHSLTTDDFNEFISEWISEDKLTSCLIRSEEHTSEL